MKIPLVDLERQFHAIEDEITDAVRSVIDDCAFVGGDYIERFEQDFADYVGVDHCIGVGNGTDALSIALKCLGVGEGDEVIVPANSFIATAEAVTMAGADVVFADCEEELYTIDVADLERKITSRTRAVIPVHLFGQPARLDKIRKLADEHDFYIVEDAAQAHGASCRGQPVGTFGDCACFSFYPGKNLGAYGDAGAVVTDNSELAQRVRMYSDHGRAGKYDHQCEGVNSRLDGIQAAVLSVKLNYLEDWTERRIEVAARYDQLLEEWVQTPRERDDVRHVYHLYVVRLEDRNYMRDLLRRSGVATGIHYPQAIPFLEAYDHRDYKPGDFPTSRHYQDRILSLPMHGHLKDEEIEYVADSLAGGLRG